MATSTQACAPAVPVGVPAPPEAVAALASHQAAHTHRTVDGPPQLRGPPAPLQAPSSPDATAGGGSAAPGGASGVRDVALLGEQLSIELSDGDVPVAADVCDASAPAAANAPARAPPVV